MPFLAAERDEHVRWAHPTAELRLVVWHVGEVAEGSRVDEGCDRVVRLAESQPGLPSLERHLWPLDRLHYLTGEPLD
jgi:hypothetical protein